MPATSRESWRSSPNARSRALLKVLSFLKPVLFLLFVDRCGAETLDEPGPHRCPDAAHDKRRRGGNLTGESDSLVAHFLLSHEAVEKTHGESLLAGHASTGVEQFPGFLLADERWEKVTPPAS